MSVTRPTELDPLVDQFQHMSAKPRAGDALEMLKKIASMVKPIMRLRNWRVGTLTEFYPSEANLLGLNVNRGQEICLRLRYPGDERQFLPLENVVDTMLHELAHIVHGPHDQAFNALWDKLRDEHEALLRKGYTGEGFLGQGKRLGGRRVPLSEIKRQARAAAERRRDLTKGSGQKLGGQGILRGQNAREIIAAAAEKRLRIERGCASGSDKGTQIAQEETSREKTTTTKANQEDENDAALMQAFIDLIQEEECQLFGKGYIPPSQENPAGVKGTMSPPGLRTSIQPAPLDATALREQQIQIERQLQASRALEAQAERGPKEKQRTSISNPARRPPDSSVRPTTTTTTTTQPQQSDPETWTCEICTLINPIQHLMCDACGTERPEIYSYLGQHSPPHRPFSTSSSNQSRSTTTAQSQANPRTTHPALEPRLPAADALARIESQARSKTQAKPMGWTCARCGTWMESQWWTCATCGRMKTTS
ncbi:hypothetical protein A1O1_05269 [Capronia coronata CBS 617.96]|uniref:WLM domain-containing protein n=1 Tax=Capronia coronata CBS 617.96 TaxID=1182541 RepID=W9Z1H2_9EURO|nr:uncharacterized protein A1O1_05269 [Capronia coronata CBS 617.96]EXJ88339.1 hypothetical protein A1O1_05269 [Capronia coronata CBS 617.96]